MKEGGAEYEENGEAASGLLACAAFVSLHAA